MVFSHVFALISDGVRVGWENVQLSLPAVRRFAKNVWIASCKRGILQNAALIRAVFALATVGGIFACFRTYQWRGGVAVRKRSSIVACRYQILGTGDRPMVPGGIGRTKFHMLPASEWQGLLQAKAVNGLRRMQKKPLLVLAETCGQLIEISCGDKKKTHIVFHPLQIPYLTKHCVHVLWIFCVRNDAPNCWTSASASECSTSPGQQNGFKAT